MEIADIDIVPERIRDRGRVETMLWARGTAWASAIHIGLPTVAILLTMGAKAIGVTLTAAEPERPPLPPVVQARFVVRGERPLPHELPNRQVPVLPTAPPDPRSAPSLNETPHQAAERQEQRRQADAAEDISTVLARAQAFAEREQQRVQEGDPDGIEEGTEREATEGDLYLGRLYSFFKRGWSVPVTIDEEGAHDLRAVAIVSINSELQVSSFRITRASGNPLFDQSIEEHLQRFVTNQDVVPPPPEEVAEQYAGRDIQVNFSGRQR